MKFVAADLTGRSTGEPRAWDRAVSFGVSKMATASFTIRDSDALWDQIIAGEAMLKIFDSADQLCFYGPIIADEEEAQGQGAKVRVTAADLSFRLTRRFFGKTGTGVTYTTTDSGAIAYSALAAVNAEEATGIAQGNQDAFLARTVTYSWKRMSDALNELGAIAGSYEWGLRYVDGTAPTVALDLRSQMGLLRTGSLLDAPTSPTATASASGGSLASATYYYKITAFGETGETVGSAEVSAAVTGPNGSVALTWICPGAVSYRVYRGTSSGGQNTYYASPTCKFTDTGASGTAGSPPSTSTAINEPLFLEYGTGKKNCKAYQRARTIDLLATDVYVLGGGSTQFASASDALARSAYRRHEDVVNLSDLTVSSLLSAMAAAHVAVRNAPRSLVSLTPHSHLAPKFGVDWQIGDVVMARAVVNRKVRVNGAARIWGADIAVDNFGNEQPTLALVPE